jgi:hypothetical protein
MHILAQDFDVSTYMATPNPTSLPQQGFISSIRKYIWKLCIFIGILFFIHHIFEYLKTSFTTPIKTNLVQLYQDKYKEIIAQYTKKSGSDEGTESSSPQYVSLLSASSSSVSEPHQTQTRESLVEMSGMTKEWRHLPIAEASELSTTQKEYLSRELMEMIQKSI